MKRRNAKSFKNDIILHWSFLQKAEVKKWHTYLVKIPKIFTQSYNKRMYLDEYVTGIINNSYIINLNINIIFTYKT